MLGKKLMLLNRYTRYLSGKELNDLPYYARNISPLNRVVFKSEELDLSIYEMTEFPIPDKLKLHCYLHSMTSRTLYYSGSKLIRISLPVSNMPEQNLTGSLSIHQHLTTLWIPFKQKTRLTFWSRVPTAPVPKRAGTPSIPSWVSWSSIISSTRLASRRTRQRWRVNIA